MRSLMTPAGYEKAVADLKHHKSVLRPQVVQEIEEARAQGDLSENAEYDYAKDKQGMIEARINDLEALVATAEVVDVAQLNPSEKVVFGTKVELLDVETDEELTYRIVGRLEADVKAGLIYWESPIARALLGRSVGDEVAVVTPKGSRSFEILDVVYS